MPELPEVETIVIGLRPRLLGRTILRTQLLRADILVPKEAPLAGHLKGRSFVEIARQGKRIVMTLDTGDRFYIHLGMTGRLTMESPGRPVEKHTHLILELSEAELRFHDPRRFGGIWWLGRDALPETATDALKVRASELAARLSRTRRAIKTVLLDQSVLAGIGNIYADEALFTAGIDPTTPAMNLNRAQIASLCRAIRSTLKRALRHKGSTLRDYRTADGTPGDFQKVHRVYDRAGKACLKCKTPIQRIVLGGRSAHFCPNCQHAATIKRARR
jgi:formamidopyrimidine-DNA glycosylase